MKKISILMLGILGLAACSDNYYNGKVSYTQSGPDCIAQMSQNGSYASASDNVVVYPNTSCDQVVAAGGNMQMAPQPNPYIPAAAPVPSAQLIPSVAAQCDLSQPIQYDVPQPMPVMPYQPQPVPDITCPQYIPVAQPVIQPMTCAPAPVHKKAVATTPKKKVVHAAPAPAKKVVRDRPAVRYVPDDDSVPAQWRVSSKEYYIVDGNAAASADTCDKTIVIIHK